MLSRLFWAAAAVALFSLMLSSLTREPWHSAPVVGKASKVTGTVRWKDRTVKLDVTGLPPLAPGKVYQLWHIGPKGDVPVDEGTFPLTPGGKLVGEDTMIYDIVKGHVFAVTMEPEGGSKTPTMPIYFVAVVP